MDKKNGKLKLDDEMLDQVTGGDDSDWDFFAAPLFHCTKCSYHSDAPDDFEGKECPSCGKGILVC